MKTAGQATRLGLIAIVILISSCGTPSSTEPTSQPASTALPTEAVAEATASPRPTQGPTATVWPPIFDPQALGDIRELDSFVVTISEGLTERTITIGYVQEPFSAYRVNQYSSGVEKTYVVDGRTYTLTGSGDWYIQAGANREVFDEADIPAGNTDPLVDAQFAGEEEYEGIAAYHFVLEPTNPSGTNYTLEGDFYLAKEGNYVLYSHWKATSSSQVNEVTEALSSINQLSEITLPADMQAMPPAAELPLELALPLPPDSPFQSMIRYKSLIDIDSYYFSTPRIEKTAFLDYYRNLPTTDGWTVSHIGFVTRHGTDCQELNECVIINKGNTQVVLSYDGSTIRAEFDRAHIYGPL